MEHFQSQQAKKSSSAPVASEGPEHGNCLHSCRVVRDHSSAVHLAYASRGRKCNSRHTPSIFGSDRDCCRKGSSVHSAGCKNHRRADFAAAVVARRRCSLKRSSWRYRRARGIEPRLLIVGWCRACGVWMQKHHHCGLGTFPLPFSKTESQPPASALNHPEYNLSGMSCPFDGL